MFNNFSAFYAFKIMPMAMDYCKHQKLKFMTPINFKIATTSGRLFG